MLVGSEAHRGPHRVRAWLPSLCQYIFLDDPRTDRIVSEPDHRNTKMIAYLEGVGFRNCGNFDFPHKVGRDPVVFQESGFEMLRGIDLTGVSVSDRYRKRR
jgi:acetyl CoA:N6-hydroxylysine acetyl transferase